jgi:hypothetical protein
MLVLADTVATATAVVAVLALLVASVGVAYQRLQHGGERIRSQQERWIEQRRRLAARRGEWQGLALGWTRRHAMPDGQEVRDPVLRKALVMLDAWRLDRPAPFADVQLVFRPMSEEASVPDEVESQLPPARDGSRFTRYTDAMRYLAKPELFEDWTGYQLVGIRPGADRLELTFRPSSYFRMLDTCEAIAHELVERHAGDHGLEHASSLPARRQLGTPASLGRRVVIPALDVLTLRADSDGMSFFLHERDAVAVAVAGATRHVAPTGVFQPPANLPPAQDENFDLWRCAVREYAEEFLCEEEARSHEGFAFDYDSEPYRGLMVARRDGSAVPLVLGIAFDPLTWCAEILCAVIFEARTFDRVFAEMKPRNLEGSFLGLRRPSSRRSREFPSATGRSISTWTRDCSLRAPSDAFVPRRCSAMNSSASRRVSRAGARVGGVSPARWRRPCVSSRRSTCRPRPRRSSTT